MYIAYSSDISVDTELQTITTFVENENTRDAPDTTIMRPMPTYPTTIESFLTRPYLVQEVTWSGTDPIGQGFMDMNLPQALYANDAFVAKLTHFQWWSPSFEVTVRLNATPMHYGRLMMQWYPQGDFMESYASLASTGSGQWTQIDATGSNVVSIVIPFTYFADRMNIGGTTIDMARVVGYVAAPLSAAFSVPAPVNISIFVRVINPRLGGFNYANNFDAQSGPISATIKEYGNKTISVLRSFGLVGYVPLAKRFQNAAVSIAELFGYSNPIVQQPTSAFQIRQPLLSKTVDNITSINLGTTQDTDVRGELSLLHCDSLQDDIAYFCRRESLLYTGRIRSLDTAGTIVYSQWINPYTLLYADYDHPAVATNFVPTPMAYLGSMFAYWRGGMKFTFSFVASNYHNCRVRFVYVPYYSLDGVVDPLDQSLADLCENLIFDISNEKEISIVIPFCQRTEWLQANSPNVNVDSQWVDYPAEMQLNTNGRLYVMIQNPLTSAATTVNPIYFQVFVSACEDFEFGVPSLKGMGRGYIAEADGIAPTVGSTGKTNFGCKDYVSCSMIKPVIFGSDTSHLSNKTRVASEVHSILSIAKMLGPVASIDPNVENTVRVFPHGQMMGRTTNPPKLFPRCYMIYLLAVFRYWRGGMRFVAVADEKMHEIRAKVFVSMRGPTAAPLFIEHDNDALLLMSGEMRDYQTNLAFYPNMDMNPIDVVIPYNWAYNCSPSHILDQSNIAFIFQQLQQCVNFSFRAPTGYSGNIVILASAADDFRFGFQMPMPKCAPA